MPDNLNLLVSASRRQNLNNYTLYLAEPAQVELFRTLTIRRTVAFSEAVYDGETMVEELTARRIWDVSEVELA